MSVPSKFDHQEWDNLTEQFGVTEGSLPTKAQWLPVSHLLTASSCSEYVASLTRELSYPSSIHTASMFAKRYAFLSVVPSLYSMSVYNKEWHTALEDTFLVPSKDGKGHWLAGLHVTKSQVSSLPEDQRERNRDQVLKRLFADQISVLWRTLAEASQTPISILWENAAVRLYSLYEHKIHAALDCEGRKRAADDFQYIVTHAPAELFGESYNPFARFYRFTGEGDHSSKYRTRTTCCFYFQVSAVNEYCQACPKLKRQRRGT
ncbi:IucA/IucC family C-terminal-domain containing protein [Paenibacillus hexagrammi]|uniref:(2Fe-2S)-binding protein n=1 Tax=Paenibacillus hexagrammi TaxID=2908839 RepID=A0ABY3SQX0_9BACL|nr:IucA/IucC family C-terminal-domain containing protein [Paenibacillus sp. YPD9-1]UJF36079.1 (2Fe-2S)-binding protein [Paenibacillus sp. YPD9-1]